MRHSRVYLCFLLLFLLVPAGFGQSDPPEGASRRRRPAEDDCLIRGGVIHTMAGGRIVKGDLLVRRGKIAAIGEDLQAREGLQVIDAGGLNVFPGLIDAHSRILLLTETRTPERTDSNVLDILDPFQDKAMMWALSRGVTAAALSPGSATGLCGRVAVVKLVPGERPENMVLKGDIALKAGLNIGMLGNAIARLKNVDALAKKFESAKKYREAWETYREELEEYVKKITGKKEGEEKPGSGEPEKKVEDPKGEEPEKKEGDDDPRRGRRRRGGLGPADEPEEKKEEKPEEKEGEAGKEKEEELKKPKRPSFNEENEWLMKAMDGELALHLEVHRAADILQALEIQKKYHLDLVLVGCTEGYMVAGEVEKAGVPVILGAVRRPKSREENEFFNHTPDCAAVLAARGIPIVLAGSGRTPEETRFIALNAALAAGAGLDPAAALEAVTISAARVLKVSDSIGSLEVGKDADIVLFKGCPLESDSSVEKVLINGKVVYAKEQ